jgi:chromosome segregation ATPase
VSAASAPAGTPPAVTPGADAAPADAGASVQALRSRLRQVEKAMAPLERSKTKLEARLAEASDRHALAEVGEELAGIVQRLHALEEEWLELGAAIEAR